MKNKLCLILATFMLALTLSPANAGTWRSTSGNMFHFYPGGAMEAYIQGNSFDGRWWWTNSPYQFQYSVRGSMVTVNIKGQGAVALEPGYNPNYWTQVGTRGEKKEDTESWFMAQIDP